MMIIPYYSMVENLRIGFKINLEVIIFFMQILFWLLHLIFQNLGLNSDILIKS